ncbi:MAG: efflux transporter outer membrane subunit, partial [Pseudomonadota bacterium]
SMKHHIAGITLAAVLAGCAHRDARPVPLAPVPDNWQNTASAGALADAWLTELDDDALTNLVAQAVRNNYALAQSQAQVLQARETLVATNANLWPSLSLNSSGSRRRNVINFTGQPLASSVTAENFSLGASLAWQLDIWGELRGAAKSAALSYAAQEALFIDARRTLAANTARAWFSVLEARAALDVAEQRLTNAQASFDIVERSYRLGLGEALDLYLARATLSQQQAAVEAAHAALQSNTSALQLLVADYPDGQSSLSGKLMQSWPDVPAGIPAQIIHRRADLQTAWLQLMAADADVAVAHRQRFPSLTINASIDDEGNAFNQVFNAEPLSWSIVGNLTQPLFQAGRLRANERRAKARVAELEANYLQLLNQAFADVELALNEGITLQRRIERSVAQRADADAALNLSLQQYERGLVDYTTVLQSQQQAFDARASVVQLLGAKARNRVTLFEALGGSFAADETMDTQI